MQTTPPQKFHRVRRLDRLVTSSLTESGLPSSRETLRPLQEQGRFKTERALRALDLSNGFPTSYPFPAAHSHEQPNDRLELSTESEWSCKLSLTRRGTKLGNSWAMEPLPACLHAGRQGGS